MQWLIIFVIVCLIGSTVSDVRWLIVFGITCLIGSMISDRRKERKQWNKGICPYCGKEWILYDVDSSGGRMYRCENWHYCSITHNADKKKSVKKNM